MKKVCNRHFGALAFILVLLLICFSPSGEAGKAGSSKHSKDLVSTPIMGAPVATKEQCLKYLLRVNPSPSLTVPPKALVDHYYEEGKREGIRPDIAFAQALQETGHFRYGGLVKPNQNNFCGLGSMHSGAKGAWFESPRIGARAHIQHLLAYSSTRQPKGEIVDPRYRLVKTTKNFGRARTWADLNGRWAIPGKDYAQKIMTIYSKILSEK